MKRPLLWLFTTALALLAAACQPVIQPIAESQPTALESTPTALATPDAESEPAGQGNLANADVEFVRAVQDAGGSWTFHVTVRHPDTGWQDYADGWDVVLPDGRVAKPTLTNPFTRVLLHPHETEQPFTRSQSGIEIPASVTQVRVRAHDLVDGWGGQEVIVDLSAESGPGFEIQR